MAVVLYRYFNAQRPEDTSPQVQATAAKTSAATALGGGGAAAPSAIATVEGEESPDAPLCAVLKRRANGDQARLATLTLAELRKPLPLTPANCESLTQLLSLLSSTQQDPQFTKRDKDFLRSFLVRFGFGLDFFAAMSADDQAYICRYVKTSPDDDSFPKAFLSSLITDFQSSEKLTERAPIVQRFVQAVFLDPERQKSFLQDLACSALLEHERFSKYNENWHRFFRPDFYPEGTSPSAAILDLPLSVIAKSAGYLFAVDSSLPLTLKAWFTYAQTLEFPDTVALQASLEKQIALLNERGALKILSEVAASPLLEKLGTEGAARIRAHILSTILAGRNIADCGRYLVGKMPTIATAGAAAEASNYLFFSSQEALDQFFKEKAESLPSTRFFDYPTVNALSEDVLWELLSEKLRQTPSSRITDSSLWWSFRNLLPEHEPAAFALLYPFPVHSFLDNSSTAKLLDHEHLIRAIDAHLFSKEALLTICTARLTLPNVQTLLSKALEKGISKAELKTAWEELPERRNKTRIRPNLEALGILEAEGDGGGGAAAPAAAPAPTPAVTTPAAPASAPTDDVIV